MQFVEHIVHPLKPPYHALLCMAAYMTKFHLSRWNLVMYFAMARTIPVIAMTFA